MSGSGLSILHSHQLSGWTQFWSPFYKWKKKNEGRKAKQLLKVTQWVSSGQSMADLQAWLTPWPFSVPQMLTWGLLSLAECDGELPVGYQDAQVKHSDRLAVRGYDGIFADDLENRRTKKQNSSFSPTLRKSPEHSSTDLVRVLPGTEPSGAAARLIGDQCTFSSQRQTEDGQKGWSFSSLEAIVRA